MTETTCSQKLKQYFKNMMVYKSAEKSKLFSSCSIPSYMRDWIVMRFSDENGEVDEQTVDQYIHRTIPDRRQWNQYLVDLLHGSKPVRFLSKVKIEFDMKNRQALFSLPELGFPAHKGEAVADWSVVEKNRKNLLSSSEVWGIVVLLCETDGSQTIFRMTDFTPFCPYTVDVNYYRQARACFTTEEWTDLLLSAIDYAPESYGSEEEKYEMLRRLLPFVEPRVNLMELAPKETGKSYVFSQISPYGWLVSGGSMSRARMFYDVSKKTPGLVSGYDYLALDEVQSIRFTDKMEMQGALKGYMESGSYHVADYRGSGRAGVVLLGNIPMNEMDEASDMMRFLPDVFRDSALLDRFHGFIRGWKIPKMKENMKARGWALNAEYFAEVMHLLREDPIYRTVVEALLEIPEDAATRDTEAVKRLCTAWLKLLFPHVRSAEQADREAFSRYCLQPSLEMRGIIKKQLGIIDPSEFYGKEMPQIRVRQEDEANG